MKLLRETSHQLISTETSGKKGHQQ